MRAVNLIPPESRRGDSAAMRSGPLAYVVVGVLALALAGVYMLVSTGNSISEREAEIAALEQELEATQARAQAMQSFTSFAMLSQARSQTIASLAHSRFDWERVMRELALVIPDDVSLTALSGSVSPGGSGEGETSSGSINAPSLEMSGCGKDHESVARFVAALRDIDGVTRVGLSSSAEGTDDADAGAASTEGDSGEGCPDPTAASFSLVVAFDGVEVDPAGGGIVPQELPAPPAGGGSGTGEAEEERQNVKDSARSAEKQSKEAVDRFVPGS